MAFCSENHASLPPGKEMIALSARSTAETAALFDAWAASYDADLRAADSVGPLTGYGTSLSLAAGLIAHGLPAGATVLHIDIGTGAPARGLIDTHPDGPSLRVTGIDPSTGMRQQATRRHPEITLLSGDFLALPDRSGAAHPTASGWDAIVSSFAFHEVASADRQRALAGLVAALAPGSTLSLLDIMFASPAALAHAKRTTANWDPTEAYHLVGDLDTDLRGTWLTDVHGWQTAPMHWLVIARRLA